MRLLAALLALLALPLAAALVPGGTGLPPEGPWRGPLPGWEPSAEAQDALAGLPPELQIDVVTHDAGSSGPRLAPALAVTSDTSATLIVAGVGGPPHGAAYYVVGPALDVHHLGTDGALLPAPALVLLLQADAAGVASYAWPSPWPARTESWHQMVFADPGAPDGWSETNLLYVRTP